MIFTQFQQHIGKLECTTNDDLYPPFLPTNPVSFLGCFFLFQLLAHLQSSGTINIYHKLSYCHKFCIGVLEKRYTESNKKYTYWIDLGIKTTDQPLHLIIYFSIPLQEVPQDQSSLFQECFLSLNILQHPPSRSSSGSIFLISGVFPLFKYTSASPFKKFLRINLPYLRSVSSI